MLITLGAAIVSDMLHGVPDNLLVVNIRLGGYFSTNHNHASFGHSLAGNASIRVLPQMGIQHGVRDLVTNLV